MLTQKLQSLIASKQLTPKEKHIAEYILENMQQCCFLTSTELANSLKVSYSSVIRLTKTLGFKGYPDFQQFLRQNYTANIGGINDTITIPYERIQHIAKNAQTESPKDILAAHVLNNIKNALAYNSQEQFDKACELILASNLRYIIASRGSNCIANFLNSMLKQTLPHIYTYNGSNQNIFDFVNDLGKGDCAIVITYPRYSKLTALATEMIYEAGAKIILITDKATCDIAKYAEIVLTAKSTNSDFYNSFVAALFVAEVLCSTMCKKTDYANSDNLKRVDKYTSQIGNY